MATRVGIVDYGMGNVASVFNAVTAVCERALILEESSQAIGCTHLIVPGVGAFTDAMQRLAETGWVDAITYHAVTAQRPFLGICLGMQLLADTGTEHGSTTGLGWVAGTVTKLASTNVRLPHIGWNTVEISFGSNLFRDVGNSQDFYFVHSYAFRPADERCVTSWCHYGERFAASLQIDNIFATQFHPEKSQRYGLQLLSNFTRC